MIKATFSVDNGLITGFKFTGHADAGDYGHDIVCAAVSALAISTTNGLSSVAHIDPKVNQDEQNGGYLNVEISNSQINKPNVQALLQSLKNGIIDISKEYNDFVEVK